MDDYDLGYDANLSDMEDIIEENTEPNIPNTNAINTSFLSSSVALKEEPKKIIPVKIVEKTISPVKVDTPFESRYTFSQLVQLRRENKGKDLKIFDNNNNTIPIYILSPLPSSVMNNPGEKKEPSNDVEIIAQELQLGDKIGINITSHVEHLYQNGYITANAHGINNFNSKPAVFNNLLKIKYYFKNGKLHDPDENTPALNGPYEKVFFTYDKMIKRKKNNIELPSRILHLVNAVDSKGEKLEIYPVVEYYYENSYLSRENGPSIKVYFDKLIGEAWFFKGIVSRNPPGPGYINGGPALINLCYYNNTSMMICKDHREYIYDGNYYRGNGLPEIEDGNIKEWRMANGMRGFENNIDKPSFVIENYVKIWYKNNKIHRETDKPAIIYEKSAKYPFGRLEYYKNGVRSRGNDMPAVIERDNEKIKEEIYYVNGLESRRNGPSAIFTDSYGRVNKRWMVNGKPSRDGKPVYMRDDGLVLYKYYELNDEEPKDIYMDTNSSEFIRLFFE